MQAARPLRVATIGHDPVMARLMEAVERSRRFELVARLEAGGALDSPSDSPVAPLAGQRWEALLAEDLADLVMVARRPHDGPSAERRAEQLKRLVQVGVPLVIVHPVCDMLLAYELDMHRQDQRAPIFPYAPLANHPVIAVLAAAIRSRDPQRDPVEQIVCERSAAVDQRNRLDVLDQLASDALLINQLLGDVSAVSAAGALRDNPAWGNLGVHLAAAGGRIARWSLVPQRDAGGMRLTLVGGADTLSVWLPDEEDAAEITSRETWALATTTPDQLEAESAGAFLLRVAESLETHGVWTGVSWEAICRSLEVTDAVERSVARRRTIELYHEQVTEQETFKSMMAAGGCAMLGWALFCLFAVGLVEGLQLPIRHAPFWRFWPAVMFAPLGVFLALQLLQLAFPPKGDS